MSHFNKELKKKIVKIIENNFKQLDQNTCKIFCSKKLDETTAELKKISVALEVEKGKTDMLLYQMLPMKVADALREGRTVDAG